MDYDTGHRIYSGAQQRAADNRAQAAAYERAAAEHEAAKRAQENSLRDMRKTGFDLEKRRAEIEAVLHAFPGMDDGFRQTQNAANTGESRYKEAMVMAGIAPAQLGSVYKSPGVDADPATAGARQDVRHELTRIDNAIAALQAGIRAAEQAVDQLQAAIRGLNHAAFSCRAAANAAQSTMDQYYNYSSYSRYTAVYG